MGRRPWTEEERAVLRERFATTLTQTLADELGRGRMSVFRVAYKMGLRKDPEFVRTQCRLQPGTTLGEEYRYEKGFVPANKGIKRPKGWAPGRMSETQIKPGSRPKNWKPIGTILTDYEGYQRIKVRERVPNKEATGFGNVQVWPLLQRHVWEQAHGPIPPHHVICFRDGDPKNCALTNLEMVHRREVAKRNNPWSKYPRELAEVMQLTGALKRKLRRLDAEEHD